MLPFRLICSRFNSKGKRISRNVRRLRQRSEIELLKNRRRLPRRQSGWPRNKNERRPKKRKGWLRRRLRNESAVRKMNEISLQRSKRTAKILKGVNVND